MATYGNFETVGRIYSIGARSVYSARAEGKAKDEFVVKVVASEDVFGEDPKVVLRDFANRAKIQQRLSEAKAKAWVHVHEVGQRDGEAYYVTDRAASSAQQLVAGRVRTEGADLHRVVSRVIEGLRELRATCQRAHGNIKPSNVLIDRTGDVASAEVLLTDPAGGEQPNASAAEHTDVRDLGELIHQLVLHTPFRAMGGYPIEDSPNWARLGKFAQQWRALCNRMLDPAASPGTLTIESLAGEVDGLKARARGGLKSPAVLIGAAAAVVLLAGGAIVAWPAVSRMMGGTAGPEPVRFDQEAWAQWCAKAPWALAMRDELRNTTRRADLERDDHLSSTVLPLAAESVELDPRNATPEVRARRLQLAALRQAPPPEVRSAAGAAATAAALEWISRMESAISAEGWSAARTLDDADRRLRVLGWDRFAQDARELRAKLARREDTAVGSLVLTLVEVSRAAPAYGRLIAAIDSAQPGREDQVPVQMRMINNNPEILSGVEVSHIDALAAYILNPANNVRVVTVASSNGAQPDPTTPTGTQTDPTTPVGTNSTPVVINNDPPPVVDIGPDPRLGWGASERLSTVRSRLREDWIAALEGASVESATRAAAEADAVAQIIASVRELEWTEATQGQVREGIDRADGRLDLLASAAEQLRRDYDSQIAARAQSASELAAQAARDHAAYVAELESRTPPGVRSPYLRARWEARRAEIIAQFPDPARLTELRNEVTQLERAITVAASGVTMPALPETGPQGFDATALADYFTTLREAALQEVWSTGEPVGFGQAFEAAVQAKRDELAAAADVARRFAADMTLAQAGLDAAAAWDEPLNRAEPPATLALLAGRWSAQPPAPEIAAAIGPTGARLAGVGRLVEALAPAAAASGAERQALEQAVTDAQVPLINRLYTWRALRANAEVPLAASQQMLASLRADVAALPNREAALRAEFDQTALARWNAAIEAAGSRAEYQAALDARSMVEAGVNFSALSPRTQFNLGLVLSVQRLEQLGPAATDDQVREALQRIIDAADRSPAIWQSNTAASQWIASVRAALNQGGGVDVNVLASRGPGTAGWAFQALDPQANRVRYTRSAGGESLSIEFVRLDPGPDGVPQSVFLATTEVSVRLFGAAANATGAWGRIASSWGDRLTNVDDSWEGPRVWAYEASNPNRLVLNSKWIAAQGNRAFEIARPFRAPEESRSLDMPVQHITTVAARTFAQANGCRLPTSQEWQAARRREGGSGWNLRDTAWVTQRDFAAASQTTPKPIPFPDSGAFVPMGRQVAIEGDAQPAPGATDGVLYFQPVETGAGSTFRHLVGNVAEFVDDSPMGFSGGDDSRSYRVIGGSALSSPELGTDQPLQLVTNPLDNFMIPTNTYADVGFRLAFDAGQLGAGPPLAQQAGDLAQGLALVPGR